MPQEHTQSTHQTVDTFVYDGKTHPVHDHCYTLLIRYGSRMDHRPLPLASGPVQYCVMNHDMTDHAHIATITAVPAAVQLADSFSKS